MTIHNAMTGVQLHEPKNMSTSTTVGEVVISKGDGTTEVRKLSRNELSDTKEHYATLAVSDNATIIGMTIAADIALATNTDYIKVTGIYDGLPHGEVNGITQGADSLTVTQAGVYEVAIWVNAAASINSTTIAFKFAVNGTIGLVRRPKNFLRNSGEFHNMAAHGLVALGASDVVDLYMASDKTAGITIEDMVLSLRLIRAT